jgi:hypothetical protein
MLYQWQLVKNKVIQSNFPGNFHDKISVPSGVFGHEGCAVVTFQKLGYPFTERKNKQGNR